MEQITPSELKKKAPQLIPAVNAYMMARAFAEVQRAAVDKIERRLLAESEYFADKDTPRADGQRITEPKQSYLMHDDDFKKYASAVRRELEREGYKIKQGNNRDGSLSEDSWNYRCPALVAESLQRQAERVLVEAAASVLNFGEEFTFDKLVCAGMDKLRAFIDLTCRFVVGLPEYKRPELKL